LWLNPKNATEIAFFTKVKQSPGLNSQYKILLTVITQCLLSNCVYDSQSGSEDTGEKYIYGYRIEFQKCIKFYTFKQQFLTFHGKSIDFLTKGMLNKFSND
jgi:hypothetical protein